MDVNIQGKSTVKVTIKAPKKTKILYLERDDPYTTEEQITKTIEGFKKHYKPFYNESEPMTITINGKILLVAMENDFLIFERRLRGLYVAF